MTEPTIAVPKSSTRPGAKPVRITHEKPKKIAETATSMDPKIDARSETASMHNSPESPPSNVTAVESNISRGVRQENTPGAIYPGTVHRYNPWSLYSFTPI
jgi:hypothetical protein